MTFHTNVRREPGEDFYRCTTCRANVGKTAKTWAAHRDQWHSLFARFGTRGPA